MEEGGATGGRGEAGGYAWDFPLRRERHYGERVVACFPDRPPHLHAMLAAALAARPDAEALILDDGAPARRRLTWAELDREVRGLAAGLAAAGVGQGDRVAILLGNGLEFVALAYAVARLGAVLVPLSTRDQTPGLRHALSNSGARLVVAEPDAAARLPDPAETPALTRRFALGADPVPGFEPYAALRADPDAAPPAAEPEEDAPATILYTSGTTGTPKGAVLTHLGLIHSSLIYNRTCRLTADDRMCVVAPLSHVTGLVAGLHAAMAAGAPLIVIRDFKAARFLATAAAERMSFVVLVPAMYNLLLHQDDPAAHDLSAWRLGLFGGAPMPAPTIDRMAAKVPSLGLVNCYGATETSSPITVMRAEETSARRLSVGLPAPGAEIVVMDDDGRECPPGVHGELWHRGANVVPGYWENPEATAREFCAGFWKSGDIGSKDADGFVHVHDRKKDMINRGGFKIFTAQVEGVLHDFPGVVEAAVIAKPCPVLGERVHAVLVVPDGPLSEPALAAHCAAALADYQRPESFTFRTDPLPRNANGKIMKREIRAALGFG